MSLAAYNRKAQYDAELRLARQRREAETRRSSPRIEMTRATATRPAKARIVNAGPKATAKRAAPTKATPDTKPAPEVRPAAKALAARLRPGVAVRVNGRRLPPDQAHALVAALESPARPALCAPAHAHEAPPASLRPAVTVDEQR